MACNCHGKQGVKAVRITPFEQCSTCAKKHIVAAWSMFNEQTYTEDNMDAIAGQLRLAANHLMYQHPAIALNIRDLAMIMEDGTLPSEDNWKTVIASVRKIFNEDHPEVAEKLATLAETNMQ